LLKDEKISKITTSTYTDKKLKTKEMDFHNQRNAFRKEICFIRTVCFKHLKCILEIVEHKKKKKKKKKRKKEKEK
jgi:hypothetical protein